MPTTKDAVEGDTQVPVEAAAAPAAPAPVADAPGAAVAAGPVEFRMDVAKFCALESMKDKRVEMLSGFYASEVRGGRLTDFPSKFRERLKAFESAVPLRGTVFRGGKRVIKLASK